MSRVQGQILRIVGLFIEMLGILLLVFRTKTDDLGAPASGSLSRTQAWWIIGCGFVAWLIGSIVIYWPRPPRRDSQRLQEPNDPGRLKL